MTMSDTRSYTKSHEYHKKLQDLETLRNIIISWNGSRLDLFELSLPNENLEFSGVMRFYYQHQDGTNSTCDQKVSTKCVRVNSTDNTERVVEILIEKFRPDMKMLEMPEYALFEIHEFGERRLGPEEKPLLVQLNWHKDDRDGRFLLRSLTPEPCTNMKPENRGFQRSLSVRMKKMFSKQEKVKDRGRNSPNPKIVRKLSVSSSDSVPGLKRSMTNPDSVIERRRLQRPMPAPSPLVINNNFSQEQNESPNSAILVKIHSELPNRNIPLLVIRLSPGDTSDKVLHHVIQKYGLPPHLFKDYHLVVQSGITEQILGDKEYPYSYLFNNSIASLALRRRPSLYGNYSDHGSISTMSSNGGRPSQWSPGFSGHDIPTGAITHGQEILPGVLEFTDTTEDELLDSIITHLDPSLVTFKLAPAYILYMATRFRASTLYRPDIVPEVRAVRLTEILIKISRMLRQVTTLAPINNHPPSLAFWLSNTTEFRHFLASDKHIHSYATEALVILSESVKTTFDQLVKVLQQELDLVIPHMMSEDSVTDHKSCAGLISVLNSGMNLLRRCRANASLTIQMFSHLFHHINKECFNMILSQPRFCQEKDWGYKILNRLGLLQSWSEGQGLELAAECHMVKLRQAGQLILADKTTPDQIAHLSSVCCRINSVQISRLLHMSQDCSQDLVRVMVKTAESAVDPVILEEGGKVDLLETDLLAPLLIPRDNYSCDIVRGVPGGVSELLSPLQRNGLCLFSVQSESAGWWNIYMSREGSSIRRELSQSPMSQCSQFPDLEISTIQLVKEGGLGLSIVAARGGRMDKLGIFIKSVVLGGSASRDGRLESGDQLLEVDGVSLIGISQEQAADIMRNTGHIVTLVIALKSAQYHGLSHLLATHSPMTNQMPQSHVSNRGPPHHVSTPELDMCTTRELDSRAGSDNYQNQEWLSSQHLPGVAKIPESKNDMPPNLNADSGQYYQNLASLKETRSPRPMSCVFPGSGFQSQSWNNQGQFRNQSRINPSSSSVQNIHHQIDQTKELQTSKEFQSSDHLIRREPLLSSNFARINSGRFRPIHPAKSNESLENPIATRSYDNKTALKRGPIKKDGSIVLSPRASSAMSSISNSSDKENRTNENESVKKSEDDVFVMKGVENINISDANCVKTFPKPVKKVSFTETIIHDVTKEENDESRDSIDLVDTPDDFIDGAENIMNLRQLDSVHRSVVVGTQEVYNDPRNKLKLRRELESKNKSEDGSSLSFREKLKLFTK